MGGHRYRKHFGEFVSSLSSHARPYGISQKYWNILHFGRFANYNYKLGRPKTLRFRWSRQSGRRNSAAEILRKSKRRTRSDFDWLLALQLVKSGWSKERVFRLYHCYASGLNVAWHLNKKIEISREYLDKKYKCALKKIRSNPDAKRRRMAEFLRLTLERRSQLGLNNGELAVLLAIFYARQRIQADEVNLSMREISLVCGVDLSTVSRVCKKLEGKWFTITDRADMIKGNTYKLNDDLVSSLYSAAFQTSAPGEKYLVANCLVPLDDTIFMRKGLGLMGYLILLKLNLSDQPLTPREIIRGLAIEPRKFRILCQKLTLIDAVEVIAEGKLAPKVFDYPGAARFLGVENLKRQLNIKYICQHKLHRLNLLAFPIKKLNLSLFYAPGETEYRRDLQMRFGRISLMKKSHPLSVLAPHVTRMRTAEMPDLTKWLRSAAATPIRKMIEYLLRTGSYAVREDNDNGDRIFGMQLFHLCGQQLDRGIKFMIHEESMEE
jgi:hypothetical protein